VGCDYLWHVKRSSWLDVLAGATGEAQTLTPSIRQALLSLDDALFGVWNLGDNIILVWTRDDREARFLAVRHYAIIEAFDVGPAASADPSGAFINGILAGPKFVPPVEFDRIAGVLGAASQVFRTGVAPTPPSDALVTRLVTRYGVSLVRERAVVLLDAVGFSLRSPLEQVAMLNSLSYSVNSAYRQLMSKDVEINFARTTTGDGFYIWNRARTLDANIALYKLMMLILTDNAVAQRKAKRFPVPKLRTAFHVGEHYEFYQVEALNPTTFGYIVGQVTIELSRMIARALPGQILLGDFNVEVGTGDAQGVTRYDTLDFVAKTSATLDQLNGLMVARDRIENIRCYLTGEAAPGGDFRVSRYQIRDKHGATRAVYNAKINIHRQKARPIYLGLQHKELHPPPGTANPAWPDPEP
jgi:hypothetical protein